VRIEQSRSLAELPLEVIDQAIHTVKDITANAESGAWSAVLLFTGVFIVDKVHVLLPWSPLREISKGVIARDCLQLVKTWVLGKMASAILLLDMKTRELWKTEWPMRCMQFLTKGLMPSDLALLRG
jgi:hypothetical protein